MLDKNRAELHTVQLLRHSLVASRVMALPNPSWLTAVMYVAPPVFVVCEVFGCTSSRVLTDGLLCIDFEAGSYCSWRRRRLLRQSPLLPRYDSLQINVVVVVNAVVFVVFVVFVVVLDVIRVAMTYVNVRLPRSQPDKKTQMSYINSCTQQHKMRFQL